MNPRVLLLMLAILASACGGGSAGSGVTGPGTGGGAETPDDSQGPGEEDDDDEPPIDQPIGDVVTPGQAGYVRPLMPASPDGDKAGIDQNKNGIRDEIEIAMIDNPSVFGDDHRFTFNIARAFQKIIVNPQDSIVDAADDLIAEFLSSRTDYEDSYRALNAVAEIYYETFDTVPRMLALLEHEERSLSEEKFRTEGVLPKKVDRSKFFQLGYEFQFATSYDGCVSDLTFISINGVATSEIEAKLNLAGLILATSYDLDQFAGIRANYAILYNPTRDLTIDLLQAYLQSVQAREAEEGKLLGDTARTLERVGQASSVPLTEAEIDELAKELAQSPGPNPEGALIGSAVATELLRLHSEANKSLEQERAQLASKFDAIDRAGGMAPVLVVAHSQGNLFANTLFDDIVAEARERTQIVHVATPAERLVGPYVTREDDSVMDSARLRFSGVPPGNICVGEQKEECEKHDLEGPGSDSLDHGLRESYLGNRVVREYLADLIHDEALKLKPFCSCQEGRVERAFGKKRAALDGNYASARFISSVGSLVYDSRNELMARGFAGVFILPAFATNESYDPDNVYGPPESHKFFAGYSSDIVIRDEFGNGIRRNPIVFGFPELPISLSRSTTAIREIDPSVEQGRPELSFSREIPLNNGGKDVFSGGCFPAGTVESSGLVPLCFDEETGLMESKLTFRVKYRSSGWAHAYVQTDPLSPVPSEGGDANCSVDIRQDARVRHCPGRAIFEQYLLERPDVVESWRSYSGGLLTFFGMDCDLGQLSPDGSLGTVKP